jgi:hypothetical protein
MRKAILITLAFAVTIWACVAFAAPMPPTGPVTIEGTIKEIRWHPARRIRATPGMSGSAGKGREFPARYVIKLMDVVMRTPSQGNGEILRKTPAATVMLNHLRNDHTLKKGMRIIIFNYRESGDEGGTWSTFDKVQIVGQGRHSQWGLEGR